MGSSTTSVQSIFDYLNTLGELSPVIPVGGFSVNTCLTIATDVMLDFISQRFNWKWNRMKVPPFYTISYQQDYAQIGQTGIGWLESYYWVDINNTALPKPIYRGEAVRDLFTTSVTGNPPAKVAWYPNNQLLQGTWPGANQTYTNPLGAVTSPTNPVTNILDPSGNILVLTTYGTTGSATPDAGPNAAEGATVDDGTCVWTVAGPNSQGFRIYPLPPQQGIVYQINLVAQMVAPLPFVKMSQLINPVPDDYAGWFREGCRVFCYKSSPNAKMQQMFPVMRNQWLAAMEGALKQGDRELPNAGFIPDRSVVAPQGGYDVGPANPYLYDIWTGR